jgi:long-chain acyl-CoA synthetase
MAGVIRNEEVLTGAWRFARTLDALGVDRRGAVAAMLPNSVEHLWAYRGTTCSGRRFTSMSWRWTPDEADYVLGNCEADVFVADVRYREAALAAAHRVPPERRFVTGGELPGFRPWSEIDAAPGHAYEHPLAGTTLLYTSGTTGRPKGVQRQAPEDRPPPTHVCAAGMAMMKAFVPEEDLGGAHLVAAPLYHSGPQTYCDGAIELGCDLVLLERFDPEALLSAIEEHRITSTFLVPTHFVRLLRLPEEVRSRYDVSSLRLVCHGAAPVAVDVKRRMIDWWGPVLCEFYGATEGGGVMIDSHDWLRKPGSVGRPRPGLVMRILDDAGNQLPTGREGTVCFGVEDHNPWVYKGDADKTAASRPVDGFYTMGDVGYVDEDGFLFLCDRRADVIISGGVNIYPAQVESVLLELPVVADCCVVGAPDDEWGEQVRAVVELVVGTDSTQARETILAHCRDRLARHQVPRGIDFAASLPRSEAGKLARRSVRDPYWAGRSRRI